MAKVRNTFKGKKEFILPKENPDDITVVIENPERIPIAKERLVKFLYDAYIRETDLEKIKELSNEN